MPAIHLNPYEASATDPTARWSRINSAIQAQRDRYWLDALKPNAHKLRLMGCLLLRIRKSTFRRSAVRSVFDGWNRAE